MRVHEHVHEVPTCLHTCVEVCLHLAHGIFKSMCYACSHTCLRVFGFGCICGHMCACYCAPTCWWCDHTREHTCDDACACVGVCILCWSIPPCLACLGPGTRGVFSVPGMAGPCHARASRGGALGQHSARLSRPSGLTLQRGSWKPAGAEHLLRDAPPAATPSQWTPGVGVSAPSTSAAPLGGHQCPEGVSGPGSVEEGPRAHKPTPKAGVSHKAATDRLFWFIILELEASLGPQLPTP